MARCQIVSHVVDEAGNAITGAKVFVYNKGTTTAPTDVYGAETGGSAVTFALSNTQGEVTLWKDAWVDAVDLLTTDNDTTAVLTNHPDARLVFAPFTERVLVQPASDTFVSGSLVTDHNASSTAHTGTLARRVDVAMLYNVLAYGAVADGTTDDRAAIQAAIDAAVAAGGGTVFVPRGTYSVTKANTTYTLRIAGSNVTLYLAEGATIRLASGQLSGTQFTHLVQVGDGTSAFTNIRVVGPGTLDGNYPANTSAAGVERSLLSVNGPVTNIEISGGLRVINGQGGGIGVFGVASATRASRVLISDVTVDNMAEGILWYYADYVHVRRVLVSTMREQDGIEPAGSADHWRIENCRVVGPVGSGNTGIDVFANTARGTCGHGVIEGCTLTDTSIYLGGGSTALVHDVVVRNNTVTGGIIRVGTATSDTVERIRIDGNTVNVQSVATVAGIAAYGIHIIAGSKHSIVGNRVENAYYGGIALNTRTDIDIIGNIVRNNGQGLAGASTRDGITGPGPRNRIIGNYVGDDQGTPTQVYGISGVNTTDVVVSHNVTVGNITGGMTFTGTNTNLQVLLNSGLPNFVQAIATIPDGAAFIDVAMTVGLGITNIVFAFMLNVTPIGESNHNKFWVTVPAANTMRINRDTTTGQQRFSWNYIRA